MRRQLVRVDTAKRLLSFQSTSRPDPDETTQIVGFEDPDAGQIFEALGSETTRDVLAAVYDRPGTGSEVAENVDTSLQNAKYHLDKLQEVELIEVGDTRYSEQGNEMKVYAPTSESVVLFAGDETKQSSLRETLTPLRMISRVVRYQLPNLSWFAMHMANQIKLPTSLAANPRLEPITAILSASQTLTEPALNIENAIRRTTISTEVDVRSSLIVSRSRARPTRTKPSISPPLTLVLTGWLVFHAFTLYRVA